jgi:hypothetical protein
MPIEIQCSNLSEVIRVFRRRNIKSSKNRYFLAGPCGVGKTTLGKILSTKLELHFIDHDEMKEKINRFPFPCSISNLNIDECLKESILAEGKPDGFIFAVGGDSIFKSSVDIDERLLQLRQAKKKYGFHIILFTAEEKILEHRYLQVGARGPESFTDVWNNWITIERPAWEKCADYIIETSKMVL